MSLEDEVQQLMKDAVAGEPIVLDHNLGTTEERDVPVREELDMLWSLTRGLYAGMLRLARELDDLPRDVVNT